MLITVDNMEGKETKKEGLKIPSPEIKKRRSRSRSHSSRSSNLAPEDKRPSREIGSREEMQMPRFGKIRKEFKSLAKCFSGPVTGLTDRDEREGQRTAEIDLRIDPDDVSFLNP